MTSKIKPKRAGKPLQIYLDEDLHTDFKRLVEAYDDQLGVVTAIRKLIVQAVKEYYLPGYLKLDSVVERGEPTGNIGKKM